MAGEALGTRNQLSVNAFDEYPKYQTVNSRRNTDARIEGVIP